MKVRVWKYPRNLWDAHWSRFVRTGEPAVPLRYVSVDLDGTLELPGLTPDCAFVRSSSGGCGLHLRVPLRGQRLAPHSVFLVRELLGDDPLRLKMDAYRWKCTRDPLYLKGITFDRKKGRQAGPWVRAAVWRVRGATRIPLLLPRKIAPGPTGARLHPLSWRQPPSRPERRLIADRRSQLRRRVAPALPSSLRA